MTTRSENGELIFDQLPSWLPDDEETGNFKLLDVIGRALDRIEGDVGSLDNATTVQNAETVEQLAELAKLVELEPEIGEGRGKFRTRLIAEYQTLSSEGTLRDILENTATLLDTSPENIGYKDLAENGAIQLLIPQKPLDDLSIEESEFVEVIGKHSAAGFRIDASLMGTFTYRTPDDYSSGTNDATKGYDGLDANGDPTDSGGTYSGLLG